MRIFILSFVVFLFASSFASGKSLQEGLALYRVGHYSKAETVFREIITKDPRDYTAQYMLAVTLVNMQNYNEAKQLYRNVMNNSHNDRLISLSSTGLRNLGESTGTNKYPKEVNKAILNVNMAGGSIIVNDVLLNDTYKTKFVLDTGASYTTISRNIAARLNISTQNAKTMKIMTGSGYINAPLVRIPSIEVNGLYVKNVEAIVMDLPVHTSGTDMGLAGLLGLSFLEKFKVTVDRANYKVILEKN
ncbi:MAG: hypothetical protein A2Y25_02695 [Candidatus Melainabacteria bacterium GWF2_37_15]|nr:MAG: hypothetical protein A2Y25_02695 [Candidatus Melainabacteria bacterium GWF2_37_15]